MLRHRRVTPQARTKAIGMRRYITLSGIIFRVSASTESMTSIGESPVNFLDELNATAPTETRMNLSISAIVQFSGVVGELEMSI